MTANFDSFSEEADPSVISQHKEILDLLPGLVAYFGPDLLYRYANATYLAWRGIAPAAIVGRHCREIVGEANYPLIASKLAEALTGVPVTYEYDLFDGALCRRVQGNYVPDMDIDGTVKGVLALVTDISVRHDLQSRIAASEAIFDSAFENAPIGKVMVDPAGNILRSNACFAAMMGRPAAELTGMTFQEVTHPDDLAKDQHLFDEVLHGKRDGYRIEKRYIARDGTIVPAALAVSVARNESGQPARFIAHVVDISERLAAERVLEEANARFALALGAVRGGFWHMDVASGVFSTSPQLARFATGADEPLELPSYAQQIHPDDRGAADLAPMLSGSIDHQSIQYRLETVDGTHWMRCDRKLLRDADGQPKQIVGVTIDVSDEHMEQMRYQSEAETDPLTGILNRRGLTRRFAQVAPERVAGILAIDLDHFKHINDTYGHDAGDAVLVEVARRITAETRQSDIVVRIGGDEFVAVILDTSSDMLAVLAGRIQRALSGLIAYNEHTLSFGGSVGLSKNGDQNGSLSDLLADADAALYLAKMGKEGQTNR